MYLQLHWAPCAFTGPVRDTPTISLVSLCVYRDAPTTPLGSLCFHRPSQGYTHNPIGPPVRSQGSTYIPTRIAVPSQGFPHSRPHRKPLLNSYSSQFPSLPSNVFVFFTSSFSVFCLRLILSPTLMGLGPVPSLIHDVSFRLGLVISASQVIILPTRLNPLTPATQLFILVSQVHTKQFAMTLSSNLSSNITSSLSLYWSRTEVCSRDTTQSCHSSHSIPINHGHLRLTFSKSLIPSYNSSQW